MDKLILDGLQTVIIILLGILIKVKKQWNPHPPGKADACIEHGERLVRLETKTDEIQKDINGK